MDDMTSLLLLLWVGVTVSTAVDLQKRIIGGTNCGNTEAQHHVKIIDTGDNVVCGGSLISDQWILTAAHCWVWEMHVDLGLHSPNKQTHSVMQITTAPVMYEEKNKIHDIMLLKLPNTAAFPTVKLPDCKSKKQLNKDDNVQIAGYGAMSEDAAAEDEATAEDAGSKPKKVIELQCQNIKIGSCGNLSYPHQSMFCGKTAEGKICSGDHGGGVVYNGELFGVISNAQRACTDIVESMNICNYLKWIKDTTAKKKGFFGK